MTIGVNPMNQPVLLAYARVVQFFLDFTKGNTNANPIGDAKFEVKKVAPRLNFTPVAFQKVIHLAHLASPYTYQEAIKILKEWRS